MIRGQKDIQHHRHTRRVGRLRCTPNIVMTMQHRDQLRRQFHIDPTHRETTYSYQNILLDILATLKLGWGTNKPSIRANGCLRTVTTTRDGKTQKCLLTCSGRFVVALTAEWHLYIFITFSLDCIYVGRASSWWSLTKAPSKNIHGHWQKQSWINSNSSVSSSQESGRPRNETASSWTRLPYDFI